MDAKREAIFFARLIAPMLKHLRRIAGSTQNEHSVEDLKSEAYLISRDVRAQFGEDIEPEDEQLQSTVVAKVQKLFGRFVNRPMRFAARLDRDEVNEDGDFVANSIAARLAAPDVYEPHVALELREQNEEARRAIDARFSEAVAYLRTLDHFDHDKRLIATYLAIPTSTLETRLRRAENVAAIQPSMFDGVEAVPLDFVPRRVYFGRLGRRRFSRWRLCCLVRRPMQMQLLSRLPPVFANLPSR